MEEAKQNKACQLVGVIFSRGIQQQKTIREQVFALCCFILMTLSTNKDKLDIYVHHEFMMLVTKKCRKEGMQKIKDE